MMKRVLMEALKGATVLVGCTGVFTGIGSYYRWGMYEALYVIALFIVLGGIVLVTLIRSLAQKQWGVLLGMLAVLAVSNVVSRFGVYRAANAIGENLQAGEILQVKPGLVEFPFGIVWDFGFTSRQIKGAEYCHWTCADLVLSRKATVAVPGANGNLVTYRPVSGPDCFVAENLASTLALIADGTLNTCFDLRPLPKPNQKLTTLTIRHRHSSYSSRPWPWSGFMGDAFELRETNGKTSTVKARWISGSVRYHIPIILLLGGEHERRIHPRNSGPIDLNVENVLNQHYPSKTGVLPNASDQASLPKATPQMALEHLKSFRHLADDAGKTMIDKSIAELEARKK
jgi:hypothetical protein